MRWGLIPGHDNWNNKELRYRADQLLDIGCLIGSAFLLGLPIFVIHCTSSGVVKDLANGGGEICQPERGINTEVLCINSVLEFSGS